METNQVLKRSQVRYITGEESTVLHTVDIWKPEDSLNLASSVDKIWLM